MTIAATVWSVNRVAVKALAVVVIFYLTAPTLVIVPLSFSAESLIRFPPSGYSLRWYEQFVANADYHSAIANSFKIGVPTALLATGLGTLGALGVARSVSRWRFVAAALFIAPLVLPHIVLAIGMYPLMVSLRMTGGYVGIIIAHAVVTLPLVFLMVFASLRGRAETFELAALTLGATPWKVFWYVTFPLIRGSVVVGFIFSFASSFDELILSMFLTSPATRTVSRLLWEQLNYQMSPIIAAATVVLLLATIVLLATAALVQGKANARPRRPAVS